MSSPLISLENVSVSFPLGDTGFNRKKHQALNNVSFTINQNEIFGVMGRNGCGKSTLLQLLTGVYRATSGQVKEYSDKPLKKSLLTLGLGFDNYLSGKDNALLSGMLQGLSKQEAKEILEEIKAFSELGDFFEQPVFRYSSGMRSKLGFATAMYLQTDILLIDETLSVGDDSFRKKAEDKLMEKMAASKAVIFVSHNPQQVERLCSRSVWLEKGKVMDFGDTRSVSQSYTSFLSSFNT